MTSSSSESIEILPSTVGTRGFGEPLDMGRGTSPSEHVSPTLGSGVYIPELGRRIKSINQLTLDQHASLSNNVIFSINCYMADQRTEGTAGLTHKRGRRQPSADIDEQSDQEVHETVAEVGRSAPQASTSRPAAEGRPGRSKACPRRGNVGDAEPVSRPGTQ